jgi:hypothetical protein
MLKIPRTRPQRQRKLLKQLQRLKPRRRQTPSLLLREDRNTLSDERKLLKKLIATVTKKKTTMLEGLVCCEKRGVPI